MRKMRIHKGKKIERYDFTQKPKRSFLIPLAKLVVFFLCIRRKITITHKSGKPTRPRLVLGNHGAFNDFFVLYKAMPTFKMNYIVTLDGFNDFGEFLMRGVGGIPKRKFASDLHLMRNMKLSVHKFKNILVMYPEARYSLDGTTSYLPDSLGKLVKYLNVPVSIINAKGNYVSDPQWNKYKQNKMPMEATVVEIVSQEELPTITVDEINKRIRENIAYDDWKWLKESGNKLTYPGRATNLNAILYQCPHCKKEFEMEGKGTILKCNACSKEWEMLEDGSLKALQGETEFSHIPDWFKWQKQNVHDEVYSGKYYMELDCDVYTLPSCKGFVKHKQGKFIQNSEKTTLDVNLYGEDAVYEIPGATLESVHVEYQYQQAGDMIDVPIKNDSVWLHPINRRDVITKVSLATEEIRDLAKSKIRK